MTAKIEAMCDCHGAETRGQAVTLLALSLAVLVVLLGSPITGWAVDEDSDSELAKKTQNPVADLITISFQNNMNIGNGPNHRTQNILNFQPVIPLSLNSDWNLITRTIMPIVKQPKLLTTGEDTWGIGDVNFTGFFSPAKPSPFIWGVGPAIQLPTTTDNAVGTRKWGAGPSAVALTMNGPWVVGILANQVWSFAGASGPSTSHFLTQYFINYNLPDAWYLTSSPIITSDWEASSGNKWTVPIGGGFGKVFRIGKLPFNANCGYYANVVRPDPGADWTLRLQIALLLPKSIFQ